MMNNLSIFIQENKSKIREVSERNITRNKDSVIVLPKSDEWRHEKEWDSVNNFNKQWINILTENKSDKLREFNEILEDSKSIAFAIMRYRRIVKSRDQGSNITVENLKRGYINTVEYLQVVLEEMFLEPIPISAIEYFFESANKRGYKDIVDAMEELHNRHMKDTSVRFLSLALTL